MIDYKASGRARPGPTSPGTLPAWRFLPDRIWAQQKCVRAVAAILIALASMGAVGCATSNLGEGAYAPPPSESPVSAPAPATPTAPTPPSAGKTGRMVGVWEGQTWAGCAMATTASGRCNAQQKVTLTLIEGASGMTGFYRCAYGNSNCYDMNETGKIVDATLDGKRLTARVAMPDATSCLYTGLIAGNAINGGYSCYSGGALIENGTWRGQRSY
jgi:hypothetical protein